MKLHAFILTAAAVSAAFTAGASTVGDVKPYVYPENRYSTPRPTTYAADGASYYSLSADSRRIERFDTRSGKLLDTLFNVAATRDTSLPLIEGFTLSPDASKVLVWTDSKPIYRHSFTAEYYVYTARSRQLAPLSRNYSRQQQPLFSPDSRMVAFVADNNIHIAKLDYRSEVAVTDDGAQGKIINGVPDWVYEEEFGTVCSMAWAPDNLTLSYLKYDETDVPSYYMMTYGSSGSRLSGAGLYPEVWDYKYPVAGKPNSRVSLHSYDVETRKVKDIALPDKRIEYIPKIAYGPDAQSLVAVTLNRDQNICIIYKVNPKSTVAKEIYTEESRSWILPATYENLAVEPTRMVVTSWRDGSTRLYVYNYNGVLTSSPATGEGDVTAYYGYDDQGNLYYQSASPSPLYRTVSRLTPKGKIETLSATDGTASAEFTPGMKYMTLRYETPQQPPVFIFASADGKELRRMSNSAYASKALELVAPREFFTMQSDGVTLNGVIVKPRNFDPSRKYPVVMYQYSGPGSQEVLARWQLDWMDAFAARGYVTVCVDGRGTGGRGRSFCDIVYKQLGHYETIDQLAAARYAARLPYADASRMAIVGWSYGGYEALMCATAEDAPYKAAVAIAPVTDWRFYDTVYAERYMQTPGANPEGYTASAPLFRTGGLGCQLLMMYGTADDNVHPANTLEFVSVLEERGKVCDMLLFPNQNHSIRGGNARAVVYFKMLDWLDKTL